MQQISLQASIGQVLNLFGYCSLATDQESKRKFVTCLPSSSESERYLKEYTYVVGIAISKSIVTVDDADLPPSPEQQQFTASTEFANEPEDDCDNHDHSTELEPKDDCDDTCNNTEFEPKDDDDDCNNSNDENDHKSSTTVFAADDIPVNEPDSRRSSCGKRENDSFVPSPKRRKSLVEPERQYSATVVESLHALQSIFSWCQLESTLVACQQQQLTVQLELLSLIVQSLVATHAKIASRMPVLLLEQLEQVKLLPKAVAEEYKEQSGFNGQNSTVRTIICSMLSFRLESTLNHKFQQLCYMPPAEHSAVRLDADFVHKGTQEMFVSLESLYTNFLVENLDQWFFLYNLRSLKDASPASLAAALAPLSRQQLPKQLLQMQQEQLVAEMEAAVEMIVVPIVETLQAEVFAQQEFFASDTSQTSSPPVVTSTIVASVKSTIMRLVVGSPAQQLRKNQQPSGNFVHHVRRNLNILARLRGIVTSMNYIDQFVSSVMPLGLGEARKEGEVVKCVTRWVYAKLCRASNSPTQVALQRLIDSSGGGGEKSFEDWAGNDTNNNETN